MQIKWHRDNCTIASGSWKEIKLWNIITGDNFGNFGNFLRVVCFTNTRLFTLLDKYLYRNNLLPITHYVNSVILVTSYFIFIIILILFIFFSTINKIYKK